MRTMVIGSLVLAMLALTVGNTGAADPAPALPPIGSAKLYPDTLLVEKGEGACLIVQPANAPEYAAAATQLAAGLKAKYGLEFPVVADDLVCPARLALPGERYRNKNLILLGNVYNNRAIMPLYAGFWCGADGAYPGGDGYVLRTVSNPWGTGRNCIILGASSPAGITRAVPEFLKCLPELKNGSAILPRLLTGMAGGDMHSIITNLVQRADGYEIRYPDNVYNEPVTAFMTPAFRYHWTGDIRWAEIARKIMLYIDARYDQGFYSTSHYRFEGFFRAWDIIEESGVFTDEEVKRISKRMVETAFRAPHCQLLGARHSGGDRHHTAMWMCAFVASDYILRNYPDSPELRDVAVKWRGYADETFRYAVTGNRDDADRYSSQDTAEMFMRWSLLSGHGGYFSSGMARQGFVFFLNYFDPLGYSCGLADYGDAGPECVYSRDHGVRYQCNLLGFVYADSRFIWLKNNSDVCNRGKTYFGPNVFGSGGLRNNECHFEPVNASAAPAVKPEYLIGMTALPVDPRRYDEYVSKKATMPERELAIDKVWFRSGFGPSDQYLMLQCLETFRDANCIPRYVDHGQVWLFHNTDEQGTFYRNGLYVSDGINQAESNACYACRADNLARFETLALSRTTIPATMGVDWTRTIVWLPKQWFLVMDHAKALKTDRLVATCSWRLLHPGVWERDQFLVSTAGNAEFHLKSAAPISATTKQWDALESSACPFFLRQAQAGDFKAGDGIDFQNLLYAKGKGDARDFEPLRIDAFTVLVKDREQNATLVGIGGGITNALGISANPECVYVITSNRLYLSNARGMTFGTETVWKSEAPATVVLSLTDGTGRNGADAQQLFAASKTWELPDSTGARKLTMEPARAAAWIREALGRITVPAAYGSQKNVDGVRETSSRYIFTNQAHNSNAVCVARKIRGLLFAGTNAQGELALAVDGTKEPALRGILTWPEGATPEFSLSWARVERLKEMILSFYGWPEGGPAFLEPPRRPPVPVALSGGGGASGRKQEAGQERFSIYKINNKGKSAALGCVALELGGQEASALSVALPFGVSGIANLKEAELFAKDTTGAIIDAVETGDLDGDGRLEILATYQDERGRGILKVFSADARELWTKKADGAFTCAVAGDVNGDGKEEVMATATDYNVWLFAADGTLIWNKTMSGLNKASGGKQWPYGEVPTGIGLWESKPGLKRIVVGGYCHMSLLDPATGDIVDDLPLNGRYVWKILKQQPDLDGDGNREAILFHYVNNSSPGDANIVRVKPDGKLGAFNYCCLIPDGKFVSELTEGKEPQLAVIGPRGFGFYKTDTKLTGTKVYGLPIWRQLYTRPISAGALVDLNGDGKKDFVVGGEDGFISAFNRDDGSLLAKTALGKPVLDIIGFCGDRDPLLVVNTGSALLIYDRELKPIGRLEGDYVKLVKLRDQAQEQRLAAFGSNGALSVMSIAGK